MTTTGVLGDKILQEGRLWKDAQLRTEQKLRR
jgi:hypothetical protein